MDDAFGKQVFEEWIESSCVLDKRLSTDGELLYTSFRLFSADQLPASSRKLVFVKNFRLLNLSRSGCPSIYQGIAIRHLTPDVLEKMEKKPKALISKRENFINTEH